MADRGRAPHWAAAPLAAAALALLVGGCLLLARAEPDLVMRTAPPPSAAERYCAWFGEARGGTLYFGQAAFWSAYRAAGEEPAADLAAPGPQLIGRFDLGRRRLLEDLDVTAPGARSGVWDVLPHPNGRVYYTTYFELSGSVDPASGEVRRFEAAGSGLNELALGPEGGILASRYAAADGSNGSVVWLGPQGELRAEWPLRAPPGYRVAAKSVAFDALRGEVWVTTDLLPDAPGPPRHDARVLDLAGRERARLEEPEIQFVRFGTGGTGFLAEVDGAGLAIRVVAPAAEGPPGQRGERLLVDPRFDRARDFAQDIQIAPDGRAVVTRWSGAVHLVWPSPLVYSVHLPRLRPQGLYYTGVLADGAVCATLCAEVSVVCRRTPAA